MSEMAGVSDNSQRLIWNCRCTLIAWVKGFEGETVKHNEAMGDMTFEEWQKAKVPKEIANWSRDREQFAEYKTLLGKDAPKSLAAFQNVKYNSPDTWAELKEAAHMERVIQNAPCELTKKKFSGFFLKPGTKHSDGFFSVGYTENDIRRLRYDIAKQFDIGKAVEPFKTKGGKNGFNIYMRLGVAETRQFLTGWVIDDPGSKPRIAQDGR